MTEPQTLTPDRLKIIAPNVPASKAATYAKVLEAAMIEFGIKTLKQRAAFLAQLAHESAQFTATEENLNYSPRRLLEVFSRYFSGLADAQTCNTPEKVANRVYGRRNGNNKPGDGYKYRGRGFIQLTGRANYRRLVPALGVDIETYPEKLSDPVIAARSAGAYWKLGSYKGKSFNVLAELEDIESVTRGINGGINGLEDRQTRYKLALKALTY